MRPDSVDEMLGIGAIGLLSLWPGGHCDGLDGPMVTLARQALETGNIKLVFPWVQEQGESEIRRTFDATASTGKTGPAIPAGGRALKDGTVEAMANPLTEAIRQGVHKHFHGAMSRRRFDVNDVAAGREYVKATFRNPRRRAAMGECHGCDARLAPEPAAHEVHEHRGNLKSTHRQGVLSVHPARSIR